MSFIDADLITLLFTSFTQAFLSSSLSVLIGFVAAFGLVQISGQSNFRRAIEVFLLLPQILPSLFILMSTYNLYARFHDVPAGFSSVIIIHTAINCGFCAVILSRLFSEKAGSYSELARVEGASLTVFLPALIRLLYRDLLFVFFTVFIFCFTSFSIPFIVGGYGSATIEVEIYEKIISEGAILQGLVLSLLQIAFLMVMGIFLYGRGYALNEKPKRPFTYGHWAAILPVAILNLIILFGSLGGFVSGFLRIEREEILHIVAANATIGTVITSFVAGIATLLLVAVLAFYWPNRKFSSVLFSFTGPSPVLLGLFLFVFGVHQIYGLAGFVVLGIVLAIFFCPFIFRFGLASTFSKYNRQVEVARTLGASRLQIFLSVIWPQIAKPCFFFAGIVAFWAAGDFALSLFILPGEAHLPLLVRGLISRYKLDVATLLMWWMVMIGFAQLLIFQGIGYVIHRKPA